MLHRVQFVPAVFVMRIIHVWVLTIVLWAIVVVDYVHALEVWGELVWRFIEVVVRMLEFASAAVTVVCCGS